VIQGRVPSVELVMKSLRLRQSIADILSTPVGSRVMRRAHGSRLHELAHLPHAGSGV
jgi:phage baseplate assembly protein W